MFMPGFLIPAYLERLMPVDVNPFVWAEQNLLASPGALVMSGGQLYRVPTLVPAKKEDGSCIHYQQRGCAIWENSPFGCAFFGCGAQDEDKMSNKGIMAVYRAHGDPASLYHRVWSYLWAAGKQQDAPEVSRERMAAR